jgi:hypothetical protein
VFVLPSLHAVAGLHALATIANPWQALAIVAMAVVGGLLLNALGTLLYRILEGYLWPGWLQQWRCQAHRERKQRLELRVEVARLTRFERRDQLADQQGLPAGERPRMLTDERRRRLAELRADPSMAAALERYGNSPGWRVSQLQEQLRRYPIDDDQVLPTRLGNAIRRFEEYGYDRYRLDIIALWYALTGVAPEQVRKQETVSRASSDFFVCLLYGHLLVIGFGLAAIAVSPGSLVRPLIAVVVTAVLIPLWYRLAVEATDDWAAAVQALVDVGRKPLAEAMSLTVPTAIEEERQMWSAVSRFSRRPYRAAQPDLDRYRSDASSAARSTRRTLPPARAAHSSSVQPRSSNSANRAG